MNSKHSLGAIDFDFIIINADLQVSVCFTLYYMYYIYLCDVLHIYYLGEVLQVGDVERKEKHECHNFSEVQNG